MIYFQQNIRLVIHSDWLADTWSYEEKGDKKQIHISPDLENIARDTINFMNVKSLDADIVTTINSKKERICSDH